MNFSHPSGRQALLVYTSIAQHRRVIEAAAAHNVAVMVEKQSRMTSRISSRSESESVHAGLRRAFLRGSAACRTSASAPDR